MRNGFRKFAAIAMIALLLLAALPATAWEEYSDPIAPGSFLEDGGISVYSIVEPDTPVRTYVFKKGGQEISRQSVQNGDTLVEPEVTTGANELFIGWEPAVTFGTVEDVAKTETIDVTAQIAEAYYVFFQDNANRIVATKKVADGEMISDFSDVTFAVGSDEGITGWTDENGNVVSSVKIEGRDVTLTAVVEKGYWITFDAKGGSYTAPQFYTTNHTAAAPTAPTKPGFQFGGWYMDEAFTDPADFTSIKATATVYAKWTPKQVNYTVIHWWENANDDDYSYHESETLTGNAGDMTQATAKTYTGFTATEITQESIAGDGSTIVSVYYKRNVYTVNFYKSSWQGQSLTKSITAKYGQNIKDQWPGGVWYVDQNHKTAQAGLEIMPLNGKNFYNTLSNCINSTYYYIEVLPGQTGETVSGKTYTVDHVDKWPNNWSVTVEDQYEITGFTFNSSASTKIGSSLKDAKFYYTRNSYDVVYINNGTEEKKVSYKYEQDISNAGDYVLTDPPKGKEGFVFAGWHADPAGSTPYNFTGKTMPAENITVYAKWVAPVHTVTVYDADKTTLLETFSNIPLGDTIDEAEMPTNVTVPEGGSFLGWVNMADDKPFNFDTEIRQDYTIYAKVGDNKRYTVRYDANGGEMPPTDLNAYAAGSSAVLQPKGDMTAPNDPEHAYFLGWAKTSSATDPDYQPGEAMEISAANAVGNTITLYAVWGPKPATTTLTYNANYEGAEPPTVLHKENGSTILPNNASINLYGEGTFARPGYKLVGWSKTSGESTVKDYDLGQLVIVDNKDLAQGTNILYAVWEKITVDVTITKQVTGTMGDKTKSFQFTVTSDQPYSDGKTTETFYLSNGQTFTLKDVPMGAALTLTENDAAGYAMSVSLNGTETPVTNYACTCTIPTDAEAAAITVTNHKDGTPDTGVLLDSLPYILILVVVAAIVALILIRKRRNRDD